jgi:hypothetical protein
MSNLIKHAKREFEILGWPGDCEMQKLVCDNILELLEVFSKQGHSGSSAPYVLNLFQRLAKFNPISPLTGEDDEWSEAVLSSGLYQNKRSSDVFKDGKGGDAYWSCGRVFREASGLCYTSTGSRVDITFPWVKPEEPEIVEVGSNEGRE